MQNVGVLSRIARFVGTHWPNHRGKRTFLYQIGLRALVHGSATFHTTDGILIVSDDLTDCMDRELFMYGEYQPELRFLCSRFLSPGDTAIDVGANNGYVSCIMARCVGTGGRVLSFEPNPSVFRRLVRNAAANGLESLVQAHNCALGSSEGAMDLLVFPDGNTWNCHLVNGDYSALSQSTVSVHVETLDRYVDASPRLVKVDVEGWETAVIAGAQQLLHEVRPVWVVEYNPSLASESGMNALAMLSCFIDAGYFAFTVRGANLYPAPRIEEIPDMANVVLVHRTTISAYPF